MKIIGYAIYDRVKKEFAAGSKRAWRTYAKMGTAKGVATQYGGSSKGDFPRFTVVPVFASPDLELKNEIDQKHLL